MTHGPRYAVTMSPAETSNVIADRKFHSSSGLDDVRVAVLLGTAGVDASSEFASPSKSALQG